MYSLQPLFKKGITNKVALYNLQPLYEGSLRKQVALYLYVLKREVFSWSASVSLELGDDAHHSGEYTEYRRHSSVYTDTQVVTMGSKNSNIAFNRLSLLC